MKDYNIKDMFFIDNDSNIIKISFYIQTTQHLYNKKYFLSKLITFKVLFVYCYIIIIIYKYSILEFNKSKVLNIIFNSWYTQEHLLSLSNDESK